jgi:hypothetical protein
MLGTMVSSVSEANLFFHFQLGAEANHLDVQVFVDGLQLFPQRHEMIAAP